MSEHHRAAAGDRDARRISRVGRSAGIILVLAVVLGTGCPTSFELTVPTPRPPPTDAGVLPSGDPFICAAVPPEPPIAAPEDGDAVRLVGDGTRASCTAAAVQRGLDDGGYIRFRCGSGLVEISVSSPLVVSRSQTVLDGEGRVTLTGDEARLVDVRGGASSVVLRRLSMSRGSADAGGALRVAAGAVVWLDQVVLTSNGATGATAPGTPPTAGGGALHVEAGGELVALDTNFLNNTATFGGAVWSEGRAAFHDVRFRSNLAVTGILSGGAIAATAGDVVLCDTELEDNRAGRGGALFVQRASLTVATTSFINNSALGGDPRLGSVGGAALLEDADGIIERSTFDSNRAVQGGGAIEAKRGAMLFENVTFVDNDASRGAGGALLFEGGEHRVVHCTLFDNEAGEPGGALAGAGDVELSGSVLAGAEPLCATIYAGSGVAQSGAAPCVSDAQIFPELATTLTRGRCGRLEIYTPSETSPVLDVGDPEGCPTVDQCGTQRGGGACDLGAVER